MQQMRMTRTMLKMLMETPKKLSSCEEILSRPEECVNCKTIESLTLILIANVIPFVSSKLRI